MNATGPVTLGDLIREGKLLWTYCRDCYRERDVDPATIPLPLEFPVPEVGSRMSCSACGSREIETKPELYRGSIEAMRRCHCHVQFATPIRPPSIVNPALRMGYLRRDASSRSMLLPISSTPTVRLPDHGPGWTRQ